jgi:hypothetical protein
LSCRYKEISKTQQAEKDERDRRDKNRPIDPVFPYLDGNAWRVDGVYSNPGYGTKHLCLLYPTVYPPGAPGPCKEVKQNADKVLPGLREEAKKNNVTTLIAKWNNPFVEWVVLKWWDGGVFNLTGVTSFVSSVFFKV